VYVSAVSAMTRIDRSAAAERAAVWQPYPVNYVDVAPLPGSSESVAITPTLTGSSGGISVLDGRGRVLRSLQLPDMSPFVVAVRP
jgi:hypothetical protein